MWPRPCHFLHRLPIALIPASLYACLLCAANAQTVSVQAKPAAPPALHDTAKMPADAAGTEFFEKKIRPLLVQQCYACHSAQAKQAMGGLALDSRGALLKGGQTGAAMTPRQAETSRLIEAVRYIKPDLQMPPKGKLPDAAIADLALWIKMGAPWPEEHNSSGAKNDTSGGILSEIEKRRRSHWAFQPVRKPQLPTVKARTSVFTPIDRFVLAGLEAKGLKPAPSADRRTLIRRAYFDLIGLPPTPDEVNAFLADKSPNAWASLIDRLLASPHYGERWGRYWLDVARYGEDQAHSFEPRLYPQGFRYRDWLAHALNSDMPYDRFIREQIAADQLNEPDLRDQLPALGFFAVGPVYYGDEKMFDQYDDRIDTLSRGLLGLTVACARCHDHKYDPISQKDYYALAGVFASTAYIEVPLPAPNAQGAFGKSEAQVSRANLLKAQSERIDAFLNAQQTPLRRRLLSQAAPYLTAAWKLRNRRKADPKASVEQMAKSEGLQSVVLQQWVKYLQDGVKDAPKTEARNAPQVGIKDDTKANPPDASPLTAWRQMIAEEDAKADLSASEPALANVRKIALAFQEYALALLNRREAGMAKQASGAGVPVVSTVSLLPDKPQPLDKTENAILDGLVGQNGVLALPQDQIEPLLPPDAKAHLAALKTEQERLKAEPFVHALTEGAKIGNVTVMVRGNANTPGEEAPRHFLHTLAGDNAPPFTQGSGRLELANAIADKNNPLTARVMVNRIWQRHFGTGLVRTASNFGFLGEPPSNPALLDYLAAQFVEQGWSLKLLHRQIMLSAVYKRSGMGSQHNEEIDPDNRLLWRMPARRLEVEAWRDAMLAVTDKLDRTLGGPSVPLAAPDNFRRTYYAAISRHDLDSMLRLFDYPDPNATTDARNVTTVPLQQLFVLNSEFMIRQAKAFAARLTATPGESEADRIRRAYLLAYSRPPSDRELLMGLSFLQKTPTSVTAPILTGGKAADAKPAALSRWEQYAQALLGANEFMYVD